MKKPPLFDDLTQLATGAAGIIASIRQQVQSEAKSRMDELSSRMNFVSRTDFDRLEGMIKKARLVQEDILKRLAALEGKKAKVATPAPKKAAVKKQATKKVTTKSKPKAKKKSK